MAGLFSNANDSYGHTCVVAGEIGPMKGCMGKRDLVTFGKDFRPQNWNLKALTDGIGGYKCNRGLSDVSLISGLHEPPGDIVE